MTSLPITGPGRYSIYTGRVTNWPMVVLSCLTAVPFVVMSKSSGGPWSALAVLILLLAAGMALNVLTASSVRATAGPNGVTVRWGVVGWPRLHYPLAEIVHAEVFHLRWWWVSWGFWWTPRRTCCTVRSGPTLRLVLRSGRTLTVSVPDPAAALAALNDARAAQAG